MHLLFQCANPGIQRCVTVNLHGRFRQLREHSVDDPLLHIIQRAANVNVGRWLLVISLEYTKDGKRAGAAESVTVSVKEVVRRLAHWKRHTPFKR